MALFEDFKLMHCTAVGFKHSCPHQLQAVLISKLKEWMQNDQIVHVLWSKEDNVQIMLEIYRQSCRLSIQCDETIKEGIEVYKQLFWSSSVHPDIKGRIVEYRAFFMEQLKTIFTSATPSGLEDTHTQVCKGVLELIKQLFLDLYEGLSDETRYDSQWMAHPLLSASASGSTLLSFSPGCYGSDECGAVIISCIRYSILQRRCSVVAGTRCLRIIWRP